MNEENAIDLSQFINVFTKRKNMIIVITLVAAIISGIVSYFILSPVYESKATVIVGKKNNATEQYNDVMMYQNLTKTYASIATSKSVLQSSANKIGNGMTYDKLTKLITVTPETGTQILDIVAQANKPQDALSEVNTVSQTFVDSANNYYSSGEVKIMDKGELPTIPKTPNKKLNIALGFILGFMISSGLAFLLEYMDNSLKTADDVKKYLDLPVIGSIPAHDQQ